MSSEGVNPALRTLIVDVEDDDCAEALIKLVRSRVRTRKARE